jgi:hypothetical protein
VPQHNVTGDKACRSIDLLLAVKGVEQSSADLLGLGRQVIEPLAAFAGQQGWWHIRVMFVISGAGRSIHAVIAELTPPGGTQPVPTQGRVDFWKVGSEQDN